MKKIIDFIIENTVFILVAIIVVIIIIGYNTFNTVKRYNKLDVNLDSKLSNYNSNKLKLKYNDNGEIDRVVVSFDNNEMIVKNNSEIELRPTLDGSLHELKIFVYYKDGEIETFTKKYRIYEECKKETVESKEETGCNNGENKYSVKTVISDKKTGKKCSEKVKEYYCSEKEILEMTNTSNKNNSSNKNNNSSSNSSNKNNNTSSNSSNKNNNSNNNSSNKNNNSSSNSSNKNNNTSSNSSNKNNNTSSNSSNKNNNTSINNSNKDNNSNSNNSSSNSSNKNNNLSSNSSNKNNSSSSNISNKNNSSSSSTTNNRGCKIKVTNGTLGNNNWYISKVKLSMEITGSKVSTYGLTTSSSTSYNKKKQLSITSSHNQKKYYGYVKYTDGKVYKCSISLKVDIGNPTVPTSEIKKYNSNGEKISNTKSYRNYKVWWGNYKATDNYSGVDHYEYSANCTGKKTNNIRNTGYYYPSGNQTSYKGTFCIRSVDKAGNKSDWSNPYYFNVDRIKPSCSVKMTLGSDKDTLTVTSNDSLSGIYGYSYNNSKYYSGNVYNIKRGTKVTVAVKDKAGNVATCTNYKTALILLGDSRTYQLQRHVGGEKILPKYDDIYHIESYGNKEVYAVAKSGASKDWLVGKVGRDFDSGAYQVHYLINNLSRKNIYYDVKIATNLGVNDLNYDSADQASAKYINIYNNLLKSNQKVIVDSKSTTSYWKKGGSIISLNLYFISGNPINEGLLNVYSSSINKTNKRTNASINSYNRYMKQHFGNKYIDSHSQFNTWFKAADAAGQPRFVITSYCKNSSGKFYNCEDGLHYSYYLNKNYIYNFYKSKLLGG